LELGVSLVSLANNRTPIRLGWGGSREVLLTKRSLTLGYNTNRKYNTVQLSHSLLQARLKNEEYTTFTNDYNTICWKKKNYYDNGQQ